MPVLYNCMNPKISVYSSADESTTKNDAGTAEAPHPLPMPAYGGYYAPLGNLLSESIVPSPPYQRYIL